MERVDKLGRMLKWRCKWMLENFFQNEDGDVNIVSMVVLIGIAVLLAVMFKTQISDLLKTLFGTITDNATKAINN